MLEILKYASLFFAVAIGCSSCNIDETKKCRSEVTYDTMTDSSSIVDINKEELFNYLDASSLLNVKLENRKGIFIVYLRAKVDEKIIYKDKLMEINIRREQVKEIEDGKHEWKLMYTLDKLRKNEKGIISGSYAFEARSAESRIIRRDSFKLSLPIERPRRGSESGGITINCLDVNHPVIIQRLNVDYGDWKPEKGKREHNLRIEMLAHFLKMKN